MKQIPCQVIAGPLGIGKTTAILAYLKRQQGRERIAVLVNDFGKMGIDGTVLGQAVADADTPRVVAVPGGCLCCTASIHFEQGLRALAQRDDVDRIFIEPSGIVLLQQLKSELRRIMASLPLTLGPTITLLSAARVKEAHYKALPFFAQLVDEADYLVANYADRATPDALAHFHEWTARLSPPKRAIYVTTQGVLPDALFDFDPTSTSLAAPVTVHEAADHADHIDYQRGAWEGPGSVVVDLAPLIDWLRRAHQASDRFGLLRLKGVVHTVDGWQEVHWTEEQLDLRPFAAQNESGLEWIMNADGEPDRVTRLLQREESL